MDFRGFEKTTRSPSPAMLGRLREALAPLRGASSWDVAVRKGFKLL